MKRTHKAFAVQKLAHAIACLSVISAPALADATLPTGAVVKYGAASISTSGAAMQVNQRTQRAIINWNSFSIGDEASVTFVQPNAAAVALNRVTGNDLSKIDGQLKANGQVFISNPNGILFGAGSQVDVGGLVATTLNLDNLSFAFGLNDFMGSSKAAVRNEGSLNGHNVALVGAQVINDGTIHADGVALASGSKVTLAFDGNGLVSAKVDAKLISSYIENGGIIEVGEGRLLMTTGVASALQNGIINNTGIVQANSLVGQGGEIILSGDYVVNTGSLNADGSSGGSITTTADRILQAGSIGAQGSEYSGGLIATATNHYRETKAGTENASGKTTGGKIALTTQLDLFDSGSHIATGEQGGKIDISADAIQLRGATVDASGSAAGGSIRIGGGYQGKDTDIKNATTNIIVNTTIDASATENGNGGRVTVWSNKQTDFYGDIKANAGVNGGDGGFIEVSSHDVLNFGGTANASASKGAAGALLLDPMNLTLDASAPAAVSMFELADPYPAAGDQHGSGGVIYLSNGNILLISPKDSYAGASTGSVYLYSGTDGGLISMLTGSTADDQIGSSISFFQPGVTILSNGNYLVQSVRWDNGAAVDAGAVTWGSAVTGVSGIVSAANSLVGSTSNDKLGTGGITVLANGNYLVSSPLWDNGAAKDVGAVTWGNGATGISGVLSAANSLVGLSSNDQVGSDGVVQLDNGNYLVISSMWNNGAATKAGAVTWGSGATGVSGPISGLNSLVGSTTGDQVGSGRVTLLGNGNYVVSSPYWSNGAAAYAGAVTWGDGLTGVAGPVSAANSLVGGSANDEVGRDGIVVLANHDYLVLSGFWNNGAATQAGAVTWANGATGISGLVSADNSLVGSTSFDHIGNFITKLANGNYLVSSPGWDNGAAIDAGAVTWGSATSGVSGVVSSANSLVGSSAGDQVGNQYMSLLSNGNYLVVSPYWDNGAVTNAGAVTWGNAATGTSGAISASNSLVGSTTNDEVGTYILYDANNYLVYSQYWNGNAGALTLASNAAGISGVVSAANSLVGGTSGDQIGSRGVISLGNGNYVVVSPHWQNGADADVGAVTWINGSTGTSGVVSAANSLVGSSAYDQIGGDGIAKLGNGNYLVLSPYWNGNAGAVTWVDGAVGISGAVSVANSLVGSATGDFVGWESSITLLGNGNYTVSSERWHNSTGAVTWGNDVTGVSGAISSVNSLVGSAPNDSVGQEIMVLPNGNYLVFSPWWNGSAGAITWGNGLTGISGVVSSANSLVGSTANDRVGGGSQTLVANGNVVVASPYWDNGAVADAGAVTWINGDVGISGEISSANSLVGSTAGDQVGYGEFFTLAGGNFLVSSPRWNNGAVTAAGAITWGNGSTGISGVVSQANSLVGSTANDQVGYGGSVRTLPNGIVAVFSPYWDYVFAGGTRQTIDAGAITWINPSVGLAGTVSDSNSLIGAPNNLPSFEFFSLGNGNSVMLIPKTAAIWLSAVNPMPVGLLGAGNSLLSDQANEGPEQVLVLDNGNYVVNSPGWGAGRGAVTWADGTTGISGFISASNSYVGVQGNTVSSYQVWNCPGMYTCGLSPVQYSILGDGVGQALYKLGAGSYVVARPSYGSTSVSWDSSGCSGYTCSQYGGQNLYSRGGVTIASSSAPLVGVASETGMFVYGKGANDRLIVGDIGNGRLSVSSPAWDRGGVIDAGGYVILDSNAQGMGGGVPEASMAFNPVSILGQLGGGADVTLQANNDININTDLVVNNPVGNGGNLALRAGHNIAVNAHIVTDNGNLTLLAGDPKADPAYRDPGTPAVTLNAGATIDAGTGTVVLAAIGGNFINNSGSATPISTNGAGRWLVYSTSPANDSFGGLLSGNQALWGRSYPAAVPEPGNRYVFSEQPMLTFTSASAYKAGLGSMNIQSLYTTRGYVDASLYGNVFTQDTQANTTTGAPLISSAGANMWMGAGAYPVAISQGSLAPTTGYALAYNSAGRLTVGLSFMQRFQLLFHNLFARFRHA